METRGAYIAPPTRPIAMQRERYRAVQHFDLLIWSLFVYAWFLDGSTFYLLTRAMLQTWWGNPDQKISTEADAEVALLTTLVANLIVNIAFALGHIFGSPATEPSLLIDFIGKEHHSSTLHLVLVDVLIGYIQLLSIVLCLQTAVADEVPDGTRGPLDETDDEKDEEEEGHAWEARDEETAFTGPAISTPGADVEGIMSSSDFQQPPKFNPSPLTHPIAVIRLIPAFQRVWGLVCSLGSQADDSIRDDSPTNSGHPDGRRMVGPSSPPPPPSPSADRQPSENSDDDVQSSLLSSSRATAQ